MDFGTQVPFPRNQKLELQRWLVQDAYKISTYLSSLVDTLKALGSCLEGKYVQQNSTCDYNYRVASYQLYES